MQSAVWSNYSWNGSRAKVQSQECFLQMVLFLVIQSHQRWQQTRWFQKNAFWRMISSYGLTKTVDCCAVWSNCSSNGSPTEMQYGACFLQMVCRFFNGVPVQVTRDYRSIQKMQSEECILQMVQKEKHFLKTSCRTKKKVFRWFGMQSAVWSKSSSDGWVTELWFQCYLKK